MSIFKAISLALSLLNRFIDWVERRELISEGETRALMRQLEEGRRRRAETIIFRDAARADIDEHGLRPDEWGD